MTGGQSGALYYLYPFLPWAGVYDLIHAHLLKAVALALGIYKTQGLGTTVVGWGAMLLLYPVCRWYLGVKRRHPQTVLRFV